MKWERKKEKKKKINQLLAGQLSVNNQYSINQLFASQLSVNNQYKINQ